MPVSVNFYHGVEIKKTPLTEVNYTVQFTSDFTHPEKEPVAMKKFEGQVAVITGGNSGIGLATAQAFANQGAKVVIMGRNDATLETAQKSIGGNCLAVQGDVQNLDDLDRLFSEAGQAFGSVDIIVANAGVATFQPLGEVTPEAFDTMNDINVRGVFFTVQKGLPQMKDGGSIVLISSVVGTKGFAGTSVYSATKAAVRSFARTMTAELAPRNIRVNAVSPGPVETPIYGRLGIPEDQLDALKDGFVAQVPLGRMGRTEEIAATVLFLASQEASFITGVELCAGGGIAQV